MESARDAAQAAAAVVVVVAQGELTPLEGTSVTSLLENFTSFMKMRVNPPMRDQRGMRL